MSSQISTSMSDGEWVNSHLQRVSRTFALSLDKLPEPSRYYISLAYLACRIPDTIEDSQKLTTEQKVNALDAYIEALEPSPNPEKASKFVESVPKFDGDDWELVQETEKVIVLLSELPENTQKVAVKWIKELTGGMRQFVKDNPSVGGIRIQTIDELEEYCHYVAGIVGHLIVDCLLTIENGDEPPEDPEVLRHWAHEYGLFLQVVNISKDVFDDYEEEDSIFIPIDELRKNGISPTNITSPSNSEDVGEVVTDIITQTEKYEEDAEKFLSTLTEWNEKTQVGFALPYVLAVATLRKVKEEAEKASQEEHIKISREEVLDIVTKLEQGVPFDEVANDSRKPYCGAS